MGLDRLIEFLISIIEDVLPVFVVKEYERAVVLRYGKIHRVKGPGMYGKLSFFDNPLMYTVVLTTIETGVQTLTTNDGQEVTLKSVVKYRIDDVILYTTEIYDATDAIVDITEGHNMNEINNMNYIDCKDTINLSRTVTKKVRNEAKKYGIYIEQITHTNFIKTRNYRVFNEPNS